MPIALLHKTFVTITLRIFQLQLDHIRLFSPMQAAFFLHMPRRQKKRRVHGVAVEVCVCYLPGVSCTLLQTIMTACCFSLPFLSFWRFAAYTHLTSTRSYSHSHFMLRLVSASSTEAHYSLNDVAKTYVMHTAVMHMYMCLHMRICIYKQMHTLTFTRISTGLRKCALIHVDE